MGQRGKSGEMNLRLLQALAIKVGVLHIGHFLLGELQILAIKVGVLYIPPASFQEKNPALVRRTGFAMAVTASTYPKVSACLRGRLGERQSIGCSIERSSR